MHYPLNLGQHPDYVPEHASALYAADRKTMPLEQGHTTLSDAGWQILLPQNTLVPMHPNFVRDLTGRVIYIGGGPVKKGLEEWDAYQVTHEEPEGEFPNLGLLRVTFPQGCEAVPAQTEQTYKLGHRFLTHWRCLDMSITAGQPAYGGTDPFYALYPNANLHPYKMRPDTFYVDGFKLPQTSMVFARQDVPSYKATQQAEFFMERWENRPTDQDYEAFIDKNGGEAFLEDMYNAGCTIIPTFEACNGYNQVSENFELRDYWPGRYVPSLHDMVDVRSDHSPPGTILEVIKPGYVTNSRVVPAEVVVSDGVDYASPHTDTPLPQVPDFIYPHQRTTAAFDACWLPTHPEHFEAPALWGWEALTGLFQQLSGPLWDPLHYYYESVPIIQQACLENQENVPQEMLTRFYPVVPMYGCDVLSYKAHQQSAEQLKTACHFVKTSQQTANVGYHPMPVQYEYELDPFWFPELHPQHRGLDLNAISEEAMPLLAPVIKADVKVGDYTSSSDAPPDIPFWTDMNYLRSSQDDVLQDYPYLLRYLGDTVDFDEIRSFAGDVYLQSPADKLMQGTLTEIFGDPADLAPKLADELSDFREKGLQLLRRRYEIYKENYPLYLLGWWLCVNVADLDRLFIENKIPEQRPKTEARQQTRESTPFSAYATPMEIKKK